MKEQTLEHLFDSPIKFKLLKFFIRNNEDSFKIGEIAKRVRINSKSLRTHLEKLTHLGFLNQKLQKNKKILSVNHHFIFYNELKSLILKSTPVSHEELGRRIRKLGNVKLAVVSGIFLNEENSRLDLLLVGNIRPRRVRGFIQRLEADAGTEIKYSTLAIKEFHYRHDMFDRFLRDILDYKHEKLINRLKIE